MSSSVPKAKVASIIVIVDDSPVVMVFSDIHAALKLKRRLREAFPDTVFTKNIENEMLEKQAKKIAGLVIQRRLFISPTLSDEDLRIEIQGKINNSAFSKKVVAPVAIGAPWPSSYESLLSEKIRDAEKHVEKFSNVPQPQVSGVDMRSNVVYSAPPSSASFTKSDQQHPQPQLQQQQQQAFTRRPDSYIGQFLTTANLAATGAPQVQGDMPVHAASIIPISIHNGMTAPLANANIFGPNAVNAGPNIIALGNVPIAQGNASNMSAPTSMGPGQGPQIRVVTLPQIQTGAVANQPGGYTSTLSNHILAHQSVLGANYQGVAAYATAGSQPAPYVAAIQQNAQQIAQLIPGSAVLTQLAPNAMVGKMGSQVPNIMSISVHPTMHPAVAPVSISGANVVGQAKTQLGIDISPSASTTATSQQIDQTKVSDPLPSSLNISYDSQKSAISNSSETVLAVDSDDPSTYNNTQEAFYTGPYNVLSASNPSSIDQIVNPTTSLAEAVNKWSSLLRQTRPASPMSVTQQDGEFYQYYKQLTMNHDTSPAAKPKAPELWSPADQLSLFVHIYDQVFSNMSDSARKMWEEHKQSILHSSAADMRSTALNAKNDMLEDREPSSSSSPSPTQSSLSSSKLTDTVADVSTNIPLDEQGATRSSVSLPSQPKAPVETTMNPSKEIPAFAKHIFAAVPSISNLSALQTGQDLLNSSIPDKQRSFSDILTQFPNTANIAELAQRNINLSALMPNRNLNIGVDQRQKQELGAQEATAQMLTHLSFVNSKNSEIDNLLRNCQPPLTYLRDPNELSLKTLFTAPNSISISPMPTADCLFPPNRNFQIDVILLLYLLSLGGSVESIEDDDLNFLPAEASSQALKEYIRKKSTELRSKLLTLYHKEDFIELKMGASGHYPHGNVRTMVNNYVVCAQNANLSLQLALQTNNDPGRAMQSLPCVLLDSGHLSLVLLQTKENAYSKDKDIEKLLESVTFMNGKLTRKEFYNRNRASQMIPSIAAESNTAPNLKKHVRL